MLGLHRREKRMGDEAPLADITFDDNGQVIHISVAPTPWKTRVDRSSTYHSQKARGLLQAVEILKGIGSIEPMTYYVVETPDGNLGHDIGYESPVETDAGELIRECYCCGAENRGNRGGINVFTPGGMVEI